MSSVQEFLLSFYRSPYHFARSTDNRFGKLVRWKAAAVISFFLQFYLHPVAIICAVRVDFNCHIKDNK